MNNAVTSRDNILKVSRAMVLTEGFSSLSMRAVALRCGVAVGSIYNYFPSKADLISATIESVWEEIFMPIQPDDTFDSFGDSVFCMFETIKNGDKKYPGFFSVHSLNFAAGDRQKGRQMMENYFGILKGKLLSALRHDGNVRAEVFQDGLSMETFVDYVFMLMLFILLNKQEGCGGLLKMIEKCIY